MTSKSDHELVPVHELLSDKEAKALLQKLNLNIDNLPKIFESDAQAVKLGAKAGQVVKINRREGKRDTSYYRVVVEG